jgi:hypothetical protein
MLIKFDSIDIKAFLKKIICLIALLVISDYFLKSILKQTVLSILIIDLSIIYIFFVFRLIIDSFKTNWLFSTIGSIIWFYISYFIIIKKSNMLTFSYMNKFLISLVTVGTLFVLFIPQGLMLINDKYRPQGIQLYNEAELLKELKEVVYFLILFIGIYILNMFLGISFPYNAPIYLYTDKVSSVCSLTHYFLIFYLFSLLIGISIFIYAFVKILKIADYFHFYEIDLKKIKSKYNDFKNCELDWIIKKKLVGYFVNKYMIKSPQILIDKFESTAKDNPEFSNKKIINKIFKEDEDGEILVKIK